MVTCLSNKSLLLSYEQLKLYRSIMWLFSQSVKLERHILKSHR